MTRFRQEMTEILSDNAIWRLLPLTWETFAHRWKTNPWLISPKPRLIIHGTEVLKDLYKPVACSEFMVIAKDTAFYLSPHASPNSALILHFP